LEVCVNIDHTQECSEMARPYTLKRRAEQQAETRKRIVEAAVELHGSVGPARTTVSMVAEKAGVQRHTFYAHFPDERSLLQACSSLVEERDPFPDPEPWRAIEEGAERLGVGLGALYAWYESHAELLSNVLRDAEHHAPTREVSELRFAGPGRAIGETLGAGLSGRQGALLQLALSFFTWRTLAQTGLKRCEAVAVLVEAIVAAKE
jgi:AcrR family transcriptional regulator